MVRRFLVLVVVVLTTVVVIDAPAQAVCRCKDLSLPQKVNNAGAIFSGTLTMASGPTTTGDRQTMSYDVKVDRFYKGDFESPRVTVKSDASEASCGLTGMTADTRYLFFARVSDSSPNLFANSCGGTGPATSALTQRIVALLGPGSTPIPPTPEEAEFTEVADAEPYPLTRLVAPGAAMVLVGLLGLMLLGALGRSRR
jgi:hypothetical protein